MKSNAVVGRFIVFACAAQAVLAVQAGTMAARFVYDGPEMLQGGATNLVAETSSTQAVSVVENRIKPECLGYGAAAEAPDGAAAITPCEFEDGSVGYAGWGDGEWLVLDGHVPTTNDWLDLRTEFKTLDGKTFVSYLARTVTSPSRDYIRLTNGAGRTWFRAGIDQPPVQAITISGYGAGDGGSICDDDLPADTGTLVYYAGEQTVTTNGVTAEVEDAAFLIATNGVAEQIGGRCRPVVTVDFSRPRAGKSVTASYGAFLGIDPGYRRQWYRSDWQKAYEPCTTDEAIALSTDDYEHWFKVVVSDYAGVVKEDEFFFSRLPVCYITTADGGFPTEGKEEHAANIRIQGNDEFKEQYNDGDNDSAYGSVVKVRGNTSAGYAKKPYKLKLAEKVKGLCGLGSKKNKHWVLLANAPDSTHMRNKLAYDFANEQAGTYGVQSTWVELVLNGRYDGVYQLAEHIRIAEDRVDIFDWEGYSEDAGHTAEDLSWIDAESTDVEGGWIFEFSIEMDEVTRFIVTSGNLEVKTMVNAPEYLKTNAKMLSTAQTFLKDYFDACTSSNRQSSAGLGYGDYADVDTMVGYFLVQELFGNQDAGAKSRYAYKDLGGKLKFGPVWDYDHAAGTANMQNPSPERWHAAQTSFYAEWLSDWRFARRARNKYFAIRDSFTALAAEGGKIDQCAEYLSAAAAANDARWNPSRTFADDIAVLKSFITAHRVWMDSQTTTLKGFIESTRCDAQTNPCDTEHLPDFGLMFYIR